MNFQFKKMVQKNGLLINSHKQKCSTFEKNYRDETKEMNIQSNRRFSYDSKLKTNKDSMIICNVKNNNFIYQ